MLREIIPGVWVGSEPTLKMLEECGATAVVCTIKKGASREVIDAVDLYSEYAIPDGKKFDEDLFAQAVRDLARWHTAGHTVLVHCRAGRNRSATTIALYLIERGWEPQRAIDHIRNLRPRAIANPVFEERLLS